MNDLTRRYYGLIRLFLNLIGICPLGTTPTQRLIRTCYVSTNLLTLLISQVAKLVTTEYRIDTFVEILTYLIPSVIVTVCYFTAYFHTKKVWITHRYIDQDLEYFTEESEVEIIKKYNDEGMLHMQLLIISYYGFFLTTPNIETVKVLLDVIIAQNETRVRLLPIPMKTFIDEDKYFYEILVLIYVLLIQNGVVVLTIFGSFIMSIQHIRGVFHVTGYVLERIFDQELGEYTKKNEERIYESVARVLKLHSRAIGLVKVVNSVTEYTFLTNAILMIFLIGVSFIRVYNSHALNDSMFQQMIAILYIIAYFIWLYINCYIGQQLLNQSESVYEKACQVPWYLASPRIQKLSILMIMRSTKPSYMSVGKIFVASHELFSSLIQTALSYATIIYSL